MEFNFKVYLTFSSGFLVVFLGILSKIVVAMRKERKVEEVEEDYEKNVTTTQSSSRFGYKRTDLSIIIPEDELNCASTREEFFLLFFKLNCFPFSVFTTKSYKLKLVKVTKWFILQCFNLSSAVFILDYLDLPKDSADLFIIGPMICCVTGLAFSGVVGGVVGLEVDKKYVKILFAVKIGLALVTWLFGLYLNNLEWVSDK